MSTTVIDSLIVKLGLDSKDLQGKAPAVAKSLSDVEKAGDKSKASLKGAGSTSKGTASSFGDLTRAAGSFLAIIGGTAAIKQMASDFIESNAALDRLSKNLGLGVSTISAWGNATEQLGGSSAGLQGTLDMLSRSQTELMLTGQSGLIPYFSALGVSMAGLGGKARPVTDILLDLSDRFSKMDRPTANNMGRMMGIDQGTMNLLLMGRRELELTTQRQKEHNAVTAQQAEEATKLQRSLVASRQGFEAFGRSLMMSAAPALEALGDKMQSFGNWLASNKDTVGDALKIIAVGLGAIALAAVPLDPLVIAIGAVGGAVLLLLDDYNTWKKGGDSLIDWERWKNDVDKALEQLHRLESALDRVGESYLRYLEKTTGQKASDWEKQHPWRTMLFGSGDRTWDGASDPTKPHAAVATQTTTTDYMRKYFQDRGMSPAEAAGLSANIMGESSGRRDAVGDNGQAYGLLQWHPDRQANFAKFRGHDIRQSTLDEQLAFIVHELNMGTEQKAGSALRGATTAEQAGELASRLYVRPKDVEGDAAKRGAYAQALMGVPGASAVAANAPATTGGTSSTTSVDRSLTIQGGINVTTQGAADGKAIADDIWNSMNYLFTSQANAGLF